MLQVIFIEKNNNKDPKMHPCRGPDCQLYKVEIDYMYVHT